MALRAKSLIYSIFAGATTPKNLNERRTTMPIRWSALKVSEGDGHGGGVY
jgi:hypothetical protein